MRTDLWTPERDAELAKLWASGMTTRNIGDAMGVTHNAVIGRVHRLGLPGRSSPIRERKSAVRKPRAKPKPKPVISQKPTSPSLEMIFRAAEKGGCRWMSGDPREMLFCGDATVRGGSYCSVHHARAYRAVAA